MPPEPSSTEAPVVSRGPATWTLNMKTGELLSSEGRARMMGYEPSAVQPTTEWWDRMLHPHERVAVQLARARHLSGTESGYRSEYRACRQDGAWIWLLEIGCIERDHAGVAQCLRGVVADITVDHDAQFRLQQRVERFVTIFDYTYQLTALASPDGTLLELNRAALHYSQSSLPDALGKPIWDLPAWAHHPADKEYMREAIARAAQGELVRFQLQRQLPDTTQTRIFDVSLLPVVGDDGVVTSILVETRDLTDVVSAQQALRTVEDQLAVAVSTANLGLWDADLNTGEIRQNDRGWTMLGYPPSQGVTHFQEWFALVHPDDQPIMMALMRKRIETKGNFRTEFRMRGQDGSWHWIQSHGHWVDSADPKDAMRMAGVHLDVTERKEAENRLHAAERLESVGKLAAGVAHEINTPVQFVSDSIYFVRDGLYELLALTDRLRSLASRDQCNVNSIAALSAHLPYLVENLPKALERSLDGLKRVSEIVSSMRELAHPAQSEMMEVDVNHIIQTALVVGRSEYKYVAEVETELAALPPVKCHAGEIHQVMLNLLINASHAIAQAAGEGGQKGLIKVSTRLDGDSVLISVSDTGAGVPEAIRHRIFEPFFTTKEVGRGSGQGLPISRNIIVNRHRGTLDFESTPGKGAVFHVRLPCDSQLESRLPQSSAERAA